MGKELLQPYCGDDNSRVVATTSRVFIGGHWSLVIGHWPSLSVIAILPMNFGKN
jgi:hypothetical protein